MPSKTKIETISMLPFGMLNGFLVIREGNAVLVDTGLPNSAPLVKKKLQEHGLAWSNIRMIVLTHGHIDHAGSAVQIRDLTAAPLVGHEADLPYFQGAHPVLVPTGPFGWLFHKTGAIQQPFTYFRPDISFSADIPDLTKVGIPARILHTPGHTPGSISVLIDDGRVIAGDLVSSGIMLGGIMFKDKPKQPPFEESPLLVAQSLRLLLAEGSSLFHLGHGGPLGPKPICKHITRLQAFSKTAEGRSG